MLADAVAGRRGVRAVATAPMEIRPQRQDAMDYDTFVGEVQNRAQLPSREDAVRVIRVVLETVSERVDPAGAENVAAQLPDEIGRHLEKVDTVESFSWDEFVDRVVEKGDYDAENEAGDAVHHARVVVDVVDDAVSGTALEDLRDQLPGGEWAELFELAEQEEPPVDQEQRPE